MKHKERSLIKLLDRLIKDRLNKEFANRDIFERIIKIDVEYHPNDLLFGDLNGYGDYKEFYMVNVYLKYGEISRNISYNISNLILNASEYVLTGNFVIKITFRKETGGYIRHLNFYSDGTKESESESLVRIMDELEVIEED